MYAVAIVLLRTAAPRDVLNQIFAGLYVGGALSFIAFGFVAVAAIVARDFGGCFTAIVLTVLLVASFFVWTLFEIMQVGGLAGLALFYVIPVAGITMLLAYPLGLATNGGLRSRLQGSLRTAAPLVLAVALVNALVTPFFFPDATEQRILLGSVVTVIAAIVALAWALLGTTRFSVSPGTAKRALTVAILLELALLIRGLPNPPTETVDDPPLVLGVPRGQRQLLEDVPAFKMRVALIVDRGGVATPAGGLQVRFIWVGGPDDYHPGSAFAIVDVDRQTRIDDFALQAAYALIGTPDWEARADAGYIAWVAAPADPERDNDVEKRCTAGIDRFSSSDPGFAAPYVLAERRGGVTAARTLHEQLRAAAPSLDAWGETVTIACEQLLRH